MGRNIIGGIVGFIVLFIIVFITIACLAVEPDGMEPGRTLNGGEVLMTDLTREELAQRAARLGFPVHTDLEKPETLVERVPTRFFSTGGIYRVSTRPPDRPRVYALGVWGKDGIKVLNNDPEGFFELAANSGLKLATGDDYIAYVTTFLESTRDVLGGPQILTKIEESWWLPKPTPEEARKRDDVIAKYKAVVEAPRLSRESSSTVVVYVIRDRALVRMDAKVDSDGRIQISETVLEPEMPTVMLR
ncbi:MAG TPA: hypothetical protein VJ781_01900 [Pyrinomonadaceae bacterium]|jgi:hypothetical protein|nr:hypothetical protein [Pyrinomonadaceae bacterium]